MKKTRSFLLTASIALALAFTLFACSSDDPPAQDEKVFVAEGINFEAGRTEITDGSFAYLASIAEIMKTHPEVTFRIVGHTDNVGNSKTNQKLSEARAKAVMDFLINKGVGARNLEYQGKGPDQPIADNKTSDGRAKNRRIEIHYDGNFEFLL